MTTKDTVVSDFMAYSPYWMTDRSQNRDGTSCVMYSPVDGEPRPGQIDRKSGNEYDKSLISRRNEAKNKGRASPLYAKKQGHAVFDLVFVDEGDLLRVEQEHTGPGQVKKRSWQVGSLSLSLQPVLSHLSLTHSLSPFLSVFLSFCFAVFLILEHFASFSVTYHSYSPTHGVGRQAVWNLHCDRTWIMTGTPVNNNATGLLSLFELCRCGASLPARVQGLWTKDGSRPLTFMEQVRRLNWYQGNKAMLEVSSLSFFLDGVPCPWYHTRTSSHPRCLLCTQRGTDAVALCRCSSSTSSLNRQFTCDLTCTVRCCRRFGCCRRMTSCGEQSTSPRSRRRTPTTAARSRAASTSISL